MRIPFNKPHLTFKEMGYISHAHSLGTLAGDGPYTKKCHQWLFNRLGTNCLLTHSCTAGLEMMAILSGLKKGDEVIMPSYTFVSTANAFVLRGAVPVFVDIKESDLNIDETLIESAITKKTRAIVVVHYAGVSCEMDLILKIAKKHKLLVFEDAAQGFLSKYRDKYLGTIGDFGAYSFHETKNIISGEGGTININKKKFLEKAEIIREKGTNRSQFFRGQVDKYTWVEMGSSYLPSEIISAFLLAQLESSKEINDQRMKLWDVYHNSFKNLENGGFLRRPIISASCTHNAHMYYLILNSLETRTRFIEFMKKKDIMCVFHYVPLHSSPAGKKYGRSSGKLTITDDLSNRLVRLPLFYDLTNVEQEYIIESVHQFFQK